ncbi:uncharacterized protein LOC113285606 [Papaver somniferum]|uniref:uncharacterized protein LOC113285606 n=1 Tax=Papaver somniferum TaxID=3469 RepID=UPI000E70313B|nr:uncharacterized protein LOC113285606 [Papaver somniferum]
MVDGGGVESEMDIRTPLMVNGAGVSSSTAANERIIVSILRDHFFGNFPNKILCGVVVDPEDPLNIDLTSTKGLIQGMLNPTLLKANKLTTPRNFSMYCGILVYDVHVRSYTARVCKKNKTPNYYSREKEVNRG